MCEKKNNNLQKDITNKSIYPLKNKNKFSKLAMKSTLYNKPRVLNDPIVASGCISTISNDQNSVVHCGTTQWLDVNS